MAEALFGERLWLPPSQAAAVAAWGLGFAVKAGAGTDGEVTLDPDVPLASGVAEAARAALWALSDAGATPVYVTRLLHAVRPVAGALAAGLRGAHRARPEGPVGGAADGDAPTIGDLGGAPNGNVSGRRWGGGAGAEAVDRLVRHTLDDLALLGDVRRLDRGFWIPAPERVVPLDGSPAAEHFVLLGGRPSHLLPESIRRAIVPGGLARAVRVDRWTEAPGLAAAVAALPRQPRATWTGGPREALGAWTDGVFADTALAPFESAALEADLQVEAYAPAQAVEAARGRGVGGSAGRSAGRGAARPNRPSQYFRWVPTARVPDGTYPVRYVVPHGRRFGLAEVAGGRVVAIGEPALGWGDFRRLLYGIDARLGLPTRVLVERGQGRDARLGPWAKVVGGGAVFRLRLTSPLPGPELRLCTALGRLLLPASDRYYPQVWEVPSGVAADVLIAVRRLGVELVDAGESG